MIRSFNSSLPPVAKTHEIERCRSHHLEVPVGLDPPRQSPGQLNVTTDVVLEALDTVS